jgi:hypothetical protein
MNDDLIGRSALLELAHNHVGGTVDCNDIARFPAVDAVEVVRCKDCVWYCEWITKPAVFLCGRPNNGGLVVKPDFFCKHGERKEVENGKSN